MDAVVLKIIVNNQIIRLLEPEFLLIKEIGEHTNVNLTGLLNLQGVTGTLTIVPEMEIQIYKNDAMEPFFQGLITDVDLKVETATTDPIERLTLKARSYSCLYDQTSKNRAFQNQAATYESVVNLITGSYDNSWAVMAPEASGRSLEVLTVQYQETDWEFLKRLASRMSLPIISSHKTAGPKLYFGTVWSSTRHQITSDEAERIEEISRAYEPGKQAYRAYIWTTQKSEMEILDIGDMIQYKGVDFYIKKVEVEILGYEIQQRYLFGTKDIFAVPERYNSKLTGISLPGAVTKVSGNQLQVGLDIDALSVSDSWYSYATFYSLFYCMPEKGDRVYLYFPEAQEAAAFVLNSVRVRSRNASAEVNHAMAVNEAVQTDPAQLSAAAEGGFTSRGSVVDITPYIDALADPVDGKMVDLSVSFEDGSTSSIQEILGGQAGSQSGGSAGSGNGAKAATAGQDYDFESMANNEKIKVLSTSDGKKVILNDENGSVTIFLNDQTLIQLSGSNINIVSQDAITFWADGNINLNAKKAIKIVGEQSVSMGVQSSQLEIDCGVIKMNAPNIWMDE